MSKKEISRVLTLLILLRNDSLRLGQLFSMKHFCRKNDIEEEFRVSVYKQKIFSSKINAWTYEKEIDEDLAMSVCKHMESFKSRYKLNKTESESRKIFKLMQENIIQTDDLFISVDASKLREISFKSEKSIKVYGSAKGKDFLISIKDFINVRKD